MRTREIVFRKMAICVPATLAGIGVYATFVAAAFSNPNTSDVLGAFIMSAFVYFFWLVGWHSAVRIDVIGIRVDNFLVRHCIPWEELVDIAVGNGVEFRLRDGEKVFSLMYGGSLMGKILGYKHTRRVAVRMCAARQEMLTMVREAREPLTYSSRFHVSPWPPLVIFAAMELIAVLALTIGR